MSRHISESNLVEDPKQVREDWFEDPAEWEEMHREHAAVQKTKEKIQNRRTQLYQHYYFELYKLIRAIERHLSTMEEARSRIQALLEGTVPVSFREARHWVNSWMHSAKRVVPLMTRGLDVFKDEKERRKDPQSNPRLWSLRGANKEMKTIAATSERLARREKILMAAIKNGVYLSMSDISLLKDQGAITEENLFRILRLQIKKVS